MAKNIAEGIAHGAYMLGNFSKRLTELASKKKFPMVIQTFLLVPLMRQVSLDETNVRNSPELSADVPTGSNGHKLHHCTGVDAHTKIEVTKLKYHGILRNLKISAIPRNK